MYDLAPKGIVANARFKLATALANWLAEPDNRWIPPYHINRRNVRRNMVWWIANAIWP